MIADQSYFHVNMPNNLSYSCLSVLFDRLLWSELVRNRKNVKAVGEVEAGMKAGCALGSRLHRKPLKKETFFKYLTLLKTRKEMIRLSVKKHEIKVVILWGMGKLAHIDIFFPQDCDSISHHFKFLSLF